MSIFGQIAAAIFGTPAHAETLPMPPAAPPQTATATPMPTPAATAKPAATPSAKMAVVDVAKTLDRITDDQDEELDWRKSIVDLMKLLKLDSSLKSRKSLATELHFTGDMGDSATMNVWLHKQVMTKLAENGGIVPAELKH